MNDEARRALEFEQRLASLGGEGSAPIERDDLTGLALHVRQHLAPPPPRPAFVTTARRRLLHRMRSDVAAPTRQPVVSPMRRLAYAIASVVVALALTTTGVAYAAQGAIPGDALYGVKRGLESARQALTTSPASQAALFADLAEERLEEAQALAQADHEGLMASTLREYEGTLDQLQGAVDALPGEARARVLAHMTMSMAEQQQVLEQLLGQVGPQAMPAIEQAIERSSHGRQVLEALQQGRNPSELAPGRPEKTKEHGPRRTPGPPETKAKP